MPRDSGGDYTLPAGNPVVAGTTITTTWANTTMNDIAVGITDSLDRNGRGGMLAAFGFTDGTVSAPGGTFENEPTSGLYRNGAGDIRFTLLTNDLVRFAADLFHVYGAITADDDPAGGTGVGNRDYNDARYVQPEDTGQVAVAGGFIISDGSGAQDVTNTFGLTSCTISGDEFRCVLSSALTDADKSFVVGSVFRTNAVSEMFNWDIIDTTDFDIAIVNSANNAVTSTVKFSFMVYEIP